MTIQNKKDINKILKYISLLIALYLFVEYLDYFIAVLRSPQGIYLNEGLHSRISLSFINNGLTFSNLHEYPYNFTPYGFFYDLVAVPLYYFIEPSVNHGRVVSFTSTLLIIIILFFILRKKRFNIYLVITFSLLIILFKPTSQYTCLSKNDSFATLLTLVVLYSLYFHKNKVQFIITLLFSAFALMTKQTSVFIVPVVLTCFYFEKKNLKGFLSKSVLWLLFLISIFLVLFLSINNYFFNTIILSGYTSTISISMKRLLISQISPLLRATAMFLITIFYIVIKNKPKFNEIISPALLYLLFNIPVFLLSSFNTGSMPVYYTFFFVGLSVFIPEMIIKFNLERNSLVNILIFSQLLVYLLFPSHTETLNFVYTNKPSQQKINEAIEINDIIKEHDINRSFTTFSWGTYGLSPESALNKFDDIDGFLFRANKLDIVPYINDFNKKKFSIIIGSLDYPQLKKAIDENYYEYKVIGNTPIYLPRQIN